MESGCVVAKRAYKELTDIQVSEGIRVQLTCLHSLKSTKLVSLLKSSEKGIIFYPNNHAIL